MGDNKHSLPYRVGKVLLDVLELYIPMVAFIGLFLLFIVNIVFRYAFNNPLTWPPELIVTGFVWMVMLSAAYVRRKGIHVKFTIIYERLSAKKQTYNRILVNVLTAAFFIIAVPATIDWVDFMSFKGTPVFRISFSLVYLPTVPFLILIAGHCIYDIVVDIKSLLKKQIEHDDVPPEMRA